MSSTFESTTRPRQEQQSRQHVVSSDKPTAITPAAMREINTCLSNLRQLMSERGITIKGSLLGRLANGDLEPRLVVGRKVTLNDVAFSIQKGGLAYHCVASGMRPLSREGLKMAFVESGVRVPVVLSQIGD